MSASAPRFVPISAVLAFVERTMDHGAPLRVALTRASRRFEVDRSVLRDFYRATR